jgi:hypothetical protein
LYDSLIMASGNEGGFKELGEDMWQLSDGRIMSGDEIHAALLEQFRQEDLQLGTALRWAKRNKLDLEMLYREVSVASRWGSLLRKPETVDEAKQAIERAHGEVLGETFAIAVGDVKPMSAVTLAAMAPQFEGLKLWYDDAENRGLSVAKTFIKSSIFMAPEYIEGVTVENFVQALIVASIVKWMPIRGYHDGKRFFVTPASKDWHVLQLLEDTPEGKDWIDEAYARSEHDTESMFAALKDIGPDAY